MFSARRIFGREKRDCGAYSGFVRGIQPMLVLMWGLLPIFSAVSLVRGDNRLFLVD